ncbi:MAG TPA: cell division protein FtsA [bacterium]|jgi:cell division protein FtsA|nr:cell division protein FtsA [bacterium]HOG38359.1 cell division protein FtsA [bacterium]HQI03261.1 cell division protein FtsA [bacterium]
MVKSHIITGLDVGSRSIKIVVAQYDMDGRELRIIGAADHPTKGIVNGNIISIEDVVNSISTTLEKVERVIGMPIEGAVIGISGPHIKSISSQGVVAVSKADGEIREEDVGRVIEAAQAVAVPHNYEILHVIPKTYKVDNQEDIKDPVGMTGIRLEVEAQIVMALSNQKKTIEKCMNRVGVDIDDEVFSILADSEAVLSREQKELGVALINIGASNTGLAVYEAGELLHTAVLPVGSGHITNDLAIGLRTSIRVAEMIKMQEATCILEDIKKRDEIDLSLFDETLEGGRKNMIPKTEIANITKARVEEIFDLVAKELKNIERFGMLPAGVVLTGGGAKLQGIVEQAKEQLRLPVFLAKLQKINSIVDKTEDLSYSTVVGLLLWTHNNNSIRTPITVSIGGFLGKIKNAFKRIIP